MRAAHPPLLGFSWTHHTKCVPTLKNTDPMDPNAELRDFEPLRVVLALGALLLGLVMSIH